MVYFGKKNYDEFLGKYSVTWRSTTGATSAGTNLKELLPQTLWDELLTGKIYFRCKTFAGSTDTGYNANIEVSLSNTSYDWDITGSWNAPFIRQQQTKIACEGSILVNKNTGEVRLFVWFSNTLNANFNVTDISFYRYAA